MVNYHFIVWGGGPRVVISTAAFHARVRGSVPGLGGLKETQMFLPHPRVKLSIVGSLRDREVACSTSDRQGSNFESCVWRTVSSHHPQKVLLAQFSLYVHKGGLKPDSFHFIYSSCKLWIYFLWILHVICCILFYCYIRWETRGIIYAGWNYFWPNVYCWANVVDDGPTVIQRWANVSCWVYAGCNHFCHKLLICMPSIGYLDI